MNSATDGFIEVEDEEIDSWLTMLELSEQIPPVNISDSWRWKQRNLSGIPQLTVGARKFYDGHWRSGKEYFIRVKYNKVGRKRSLYKEWPKLCLNSQWLWNWMCNHGDVRETGLHTYLITNATGAAEYTLHSKRNEYEYIYKLVRYKGTVK